MQTVELMDDDFDNFYPVTAAIRDTQTARTNLQTETARLLLKDIFTRVRQAAERGEGQLERAFSVDCPADIQCIGLQFIRACGYKVHPDAFGGLILWADPLHPSDND